MKYLLATAALATALALPALADNNGNNVINHDGVAVGGNVNGSTINNGSVGSGAFSPTASANSTNANINNNSNSSRSSSESSASARQEQGQLQGQTAMSGVSGSGNSSVSIKDRLQAPAVVSPGLAATFDCLGSFSGGVGVPGVGFNFGGTQPIEECLNAYTARLAREFGEDADTQIAYLCEGKRYAKHSKKCKEKGYAPSADVYRDDVVETDHLPVSSGSPAKH